jgi:ribonuclease Z
MMGKERIKNTRLPALLILGVGIVLGILIAQFRSEHAEAAGGIVKTPTGTAPDRYVYYPGTEELKPDEIRLIACGTGMPSARRSQAG